MEETMRKGKREWQDPAVLLPDEGRTPMMFLLEDGTEHIGRFNPDTKSFVTRDINGLKNGEYPEVKGWRPVVENAKDYIVATLNRRALGETSSKEGDGQAPSEIRGPRQDPLVGLKLGERIPKRRRWTG
jgi:hypothetical protein